MTLGEGKRKVYKLIDEYSSGGAVTEDEDIEAKMADFFDIAQKDVCKRQRLIKTVNLPQTDENGNESYEMPKDYISPFRIWIDGAETRRRYLFKARTFVRRGDEKNIEIEYYAHPGTIDGSTADDTELEMGEDGAQAACFYVAYLQLCTDLVIDATPLYQEYLRLMAALDGAETIPQSVTNTVWR